MIWAKVNTERLDAEPGRKGLCPLCEKEVIARCGEINVWHWAHKKNQGCDEWYENETYWHYHWKMAFGKENTEIVINKDGKRHFADILTTTGVVIELQNSPIKPAVIKQREDFYGERMIWIINGIDFKHNFHIDGGISQDYSVPRAKKYLDNGSENPNYEQEKQWDKELAIEHAGKPKQMQDSEFDWKYARKSWRDVKRPVFIDFGDDKLFMIKEFTFETMFGCGRYITKKAFITKYKGDYSYLTEKGL